MILLFTILLSAFFVDAMDNTDTLITPAPSIISFYEQEIKKIDNYLEKNPSLSSLCKESHYKHWIQRWSTDKKFFEDCIHVVVAKNWTPFISEDNVKMERGKSHSVVEQSLKMEYEFKQNFLNRIRSGKSQ